MIRAHRAGDAANSVDLLADPAPSWKLEAGRWELEAGRS
jgi:hypothetical protein